jgi:hypothetical protein
LKKTPEEHPDFSFLSPALKMMKKVGCLVNDVCDSNKVSREDPNRPIINVRVPLPKAAGGTAGASALIGVVLSAKIHIHGAKGLLRASDVYAVATVGTDIYTTSIAKETRDPKWEETWEINAVNPLRELVVEVHRKSVVLNGFLGKLRERLLRPVDLLLTSPDVTPNTVISKKKQNICLRPSQGEDIDVTGSVSLSIEVFVSQITEPKSIDSRMFSQIWRKHSSRMSMDVELTDVTSYRLFDDLCTLFHFRTHEMLTNFFLRLLSFKSASTPENEPLLQVLF